MELVAVDAHHDTTAIPSEVRHHHNDVAITHIDGYVFPISTFHDNSLMILALHIDMDVGDTDGVFFAVHVKHHWRATGNVDHRCISFSLHHKCSNQKTDKKHTLESEASHFGWFTPRHNQVTLSSTTRAYTILRTRKLSTWQWVTAYISGNNTATKLRSSNLSLEREEKGNKWTLATSGTGVLALKFTERQALNLDINDISVTTTTSFKVIGHKPRMSTNWEIGGSGTTNMQEQWVMSGQGLWVNARRHMTLILQPPNYLLVNLELWD